MNLFIVILHKSWVDQYSSLRGNLHCHPEVARLEGDVLGIPSFARQDRGSPLSRVVTKAFASHLSIRTRYISRQVYHYFDPTNHLF